MLNKVGFGFPKSTFLFIFAKLILTLKFMRFFYAFVAFLVSCASVFAQANLMGTITDASGQPLPGVTVSVLENRLRAVTLRMEMEITEFPS